MSRLSILALIAACAPGSSDAPVPWESPQATGTSAPRIAGLTLSVTPPVPGDELTITVTGAGAFEQIRVGRSLAGPGAGPCFGTLSALCLDLAGPVSVHATLTADAGGVAVATQTLPETLPVGTNVAFQAVIPRGTSGLNWVESNVVTTQIADAPLHAGLFQPGDLRITEILADPDAVSDAAGEWFEIDNASGLDANLDGLVISDGVSVHTVAGTTFLAAGDRLVFGASTNTAVNGGAAVDRAWSGLSLANTFGEVTILDGAVAVDVVGWDDGASFPLRAGASLTLDSDADHLDNDLGSTWCVADTVFGSGDRGTPGEVNDSCDPLEISLADANAEIVGTTERFGEGVASAGDLDGDGFDDLLVSGPNHDGGGIYGSGSLWILHGPLVGAVSVASADGRLDGVDTYGGAAKSFAAVGDVDGDAVGDLLIGAPYALDGTDDVGIAYLVTDPVVGPTSLSTAHARLIGEDPVDEAGKGVARIGDWNADGYADLVVGAPGHDTNGPETGVVYVVHGPIVGDVDLANADARLYGDADYSEAGSQVAGIGDVNGDNVPDLAVLAPRDGTNGLWTGAVYIVHGPVTGDHDLSVLSAATLRGEAHAEGLGLQIARAGDVDADGYDDLIIGSPTAAAAYLFYGPIVGDLLLADADAVFSLADTHSDSEGSSVAGPGDLNGDGFDDLLIGADTADAPGFNTGAAYVVYGPVLGDLDLTEADVILQGPTTSAYAGRSVAGAGDLDGDGLIDLAVSSAQADGAWLVLGQEL